MRQPYEIPGCDVAREEIIEARLAGLKGETDGLEGHALLARLKLAPALMYLDGREDQVSEEDRPLAGTVMTVSTATRQKVALSLSRAKTMHNAAQGEAEAHRKVIELDRLAQHNVQRLGDWIDARLEGQWTPRGKLRPQVASRGPAVLR